MNRLGLAAAMGALALLSFFVFPGHTWLQQDSQIYAPLLEHELDPSLLGNDLVVQRPHLAYTLYDEIAIAARCVTRIAFREIVQAQQLAARALGIWGIYLLAIALGLRPWPALAVAAIASLGAEIAGPAVLTIEYEPTPRAIAVPLLFLTMGMAATRRSMAASIAAGAAFLYHPLTALPVWVVLIIVLLRRRHLAALLPLAASMAILVTAARLQAGEGSIWFGHLTAADQAVQRIRASYIWISTWPAATILHHLLVFVVACAALWRVGRKAPFEVRAFLLGLPALGLLAMPASWLLLEQWHWALVPQLQPLRMLLFGVAAMVVLTAAAGVSAALRGGWREAALWLFPAYWISMQGAFLGSFAWTPLVLAAGLALVTALARRFALAVALAAFALLPLAGIGAIPRLRTPELEQLAEWARASTPRDAVFLFPDTFRGLEPGVFRAEGLRAVYVDWKSGGQVNYLKGFGEQWLPRWRETMPRKFTPALLPALEKRGIDYLVLHKRNELGAPAVFSNGSFVVYPMSALSGAGAGSSR